MLSLDVKVGQVVEIGDVVAIKLVEKRGQRIRMVIATHLAPIRILTTGIIPPKYSVGIRDDAPAAMMAAG